MKLSDINPVVHDTNLTQWHKFLHLVKIAYHLFMTTITKRKNHWFVQVRLKDHKPIRKSFDTESKAVILAANTEAELKSGVYVDPREIFNTSLSECFDPYRSEISSKKKGASQESYRIAMWQADELAYQSIQMVVFLIIQIRVLPVCLVSIAKDWG